jgi:REP element-mobilizing transposase RayT
MPQSFGALYVHLVFSTKHREPTISPGWQQPLFDYFGGVMRNTGNTLLAAGGVADHVHLLVSLSREASVAEVVRLLKANSSRWAHEQWPGLQTFAWQSGYGAFSVSYSALSSVKAYLARQESHHRRMTFQDEYRELLRRHDMQWDERYIWD